MERTLDMQFIRYVNLFEKITKIHIQHCFLYNSGIVFVVPSEKISRAIGEQGKNIKRLSEILGRKVRIVASPEGREDVEKFISAIIYPVKFNKLEIKDDAMVINAGRQSKAVLIGRNRSRLHEMEKILESYFGIKELRVV